ncbi:MAG TPA: hypothetical protein VJ774_04685 [Actinomycetota bacterium]|nr:hypothetical protein [Actinomycetota bacterium]
MHEFESGAEPPPVPEGHLDILEALSPQELLRCYREANIDRYHHIRKHHPNEDAGAYLDNFLSRVMERLIVSRDRTEAKRLAINLGMSNEPMDMDPEAERKSALEGLRCAASRAVSRYRAHVTEGHTAPNESENEYLQRLVERVRPQHLR